MTPGSADNQMGVFIFADQEMGVPRRYLFILAQYNMSRLGADRYGFLIPFLLSA